MEKVVETPLKDPIQSENTISGYKTPPQNQPTYQISQNSGNDCCKSSTPDRLKVPKAFKFPERYTSPTDLMMSPISRGLLARSRRGGAVHLPPSKNQTEVQELHVQDVGKC